MRRTIFVAAAFLATATALPAQGRKAIPEIRPFAGASIPTGAQRDLFKDAPIVGLEAAVELKPSLHLLGSFGWVPGQNKYGVTKDNVSIFQYDVGLELSLVRSLSDHWLFKPFVGVGGGARTYSYQASTLSSRTCAAGYGAVGTEFQVGRTAFRVEGRDNVFCFKSPLAGGDSRTRNDIGGAIGLAYHFGQPGR